MIKIFTLFTHFHNLFTLPIQIRRFSCYYSKSKASEEDVPYETKGFDYGKYALVSQNYSVIIRFLDIYVYCNYFIYFKSFLCAFVYSPYFFILIMNNLNRCTWWNDIACIIFWSLYQYHLIFSCCVNCFLFLFISVFKCFRTEFDFCRGNNLLLISNKI